MRPVLFNIYGTPIPSYYTIITLAIFVGIFIYLHFAKLFKLNEKLSIDSAIIVLLTAFPGARLFHVLFEMPEFYLKNPSKIFAVWEGGFVFYGSVIIPILALLIFLLAKKQLNKLFILTDAFVIALSMGSFIGRWACFFQGCCYGRVAENLPWAVKFHDHLGSAPLGVWLHPTQLYMSFYNLLIFVILLFVYKYFYRDNLLKRTNEVSFTKIKFGMLTFVYFILYSMSRFVIEYYRADFRGDFFKPYLSTSQFISLIMSFLSLLFLRFIYKKNK